MIDIQKDVALKSLNTFGITASTKYFCEVTSAADLQSLTQHKTFQQENSLILGGGSNLLFTKDFDGLVVKIKIKGITITDENDTHLWVKAGAGEVWHNFVLHCIAQGWGGVENLSLIPGTVGAAPMQNIGAYGVEIKDVFDRLEAVNKATGQIETFDNESCKFGYRESIFKNVAKGKYIITSVTFKLSKQHEFNTSYGAIKDTLDEMGTSSLSIKTVSDAVIKIRQSKLPDPAEIGNAGSFFKNPTIDTTDYEGLEAEYPGIPGYKLGNGNVKVPAAWLIDQCGWKGKTFGEIGVHKKQPLVLVNYGNGKGSEIWQLAQDIQASVAAKFGIILQPEVNVV